MNKKFFIRIATIIAIVGMIVACNCALAYSGDGFSIDIPSTYTSMGNNMWQKSSEANINIQVTNNEDGEAATKETLDKLVKQLEKQYSSWNIEESEVTKAANGNYKCLHITSKVMGMYVDQYAIPTKDKIYTITIGAADKSYFSSDEAKDMIKSFKIDNYKEPKSGNAAVIIAVVVVIAVVAGAVVVIKKKKSQN